MLRIFHNKRITRIILIALMIIIAPAFVLWGVSFYQRNNKGEQENFGRIFGRQVGRQEFVSALKASQLQMRMQFGQAYDELLKYVDLRSVALERLVLLSEARRRHIRASDKEVIDTVVNDPSFQRNGVFDKSYYESVISYGLRMPTREYEEQVRQNIVLKKLADQVTGTQITVTEQDVREAYRKEHEKYSIAYAAALPADLASGVQVSDQEMKDHFAAHSLDFKQPLSFNLDYVATDKEHQVTAINARLEKEPLDKIAKDMGLEIKQTGLFTQSDPIPGIGWSQELSTQLADAKPGKVFAPLEIEKKYYILRLKERKEPYVPDFETAKDKVKAAMVKERSRQLARDKITAALEKLKGEAAKGQQWDLEKTAAAYGLKGGSTAPFKFGTYLENIGASDSFYTAASSLQEGQISDVVETPTGFYVVKLKSKEPIDEKKFEQDKEPVRKQLIAAKKSEIFGKFAADLVKKALQ
ncbi:MAG: SurA N-terminal domain-containing protein [Deltaproteobacteria bacterium]